MIKFVTLILTGFWFILTPIFPNSLIMPIVIGVCFLFWALEEYFKNKDCNCNNITNLGNIPKKGK